MYPGGVSETEMMLAYGCCHFGSKAGELAGNHFLTVTEGKEKLMDMSLHFQEEVLFLYLRTESKQLHHSNEHELFYFLSATFF